MNRKDITGFTLGVLGWTCEFVIVQHRLATIAICKEHGRELVKRWER